MVICPLQGQELSLRRPRRDAPDAIASVPFRDELKPIPVEIEVLTVLRSKNRPGLSTGAEQLSKLAEEVRLRCPQDQEEFGIKKT